MFDILLQNWFLIFCFFIIATLYSSVGFGGGSSYLAILALFGIAFSQLRSTALICNIIVVSGNLYLFVREKQINWKKITPIVALSIPLSFIGGFLKINQKFFFILLGITLLFASTSMWFSKNIANHNSKMKNEKIIKNVYYGGFIGFISGMVGIGGGIFLAPLLHLTNWDTPKKIAATASIFIFFNSIAGFLGQYLNPSLEIDWKITLILMTVVFLGGQVGSRMSHKLLKPIQLKKATAILIAFVSIRILIRYLF